MSLVEHAAKLRKEASERTTEAERIERLAADFPDLRRHVGRWEKIVYCSKSVNAKVTDFETRYNCGCCADSPLEFWAYLETPNGRVYSDPPSFFIGEKGHFYGTAVAKAGWKDQLHNANIPEALIERMDTRFDYDKERARDLLESSYEASEEPDPIL